MEIQDIWTELKYIRQGNNEADTNFQALTTRWANRTLKEIWMGKGMDTTPDWWWLRLSYTFPTVADQMTYDLPTVIDGQKVFTVREKDNDQKLDFIDQRRFDKFIPDESIGSGSPTAYTLWGRDATTKKPYIRLYPVPDSVITMYIRFLGNLTMFDNDVATSTTEVPDKYLPVVMDGVLEKFYTLHPEYGNTQIAMASFIKGIESMNEDNKSIDNEQVAESHGDVGYGYPRFQYPVAE